jgi:hypothetical protein
MDEETSYNNTTIAPAMAPEKTIQPKQPFNKYQNSHFDIGPFNKN